ncbi:hypothetical protein NQZ68_031479 [Dissostichus eleginoides]|nr:hypothetical protein NQZ68_031479 [Dissostichus eleginoides]
MLFSRELEREKDKKLRSMQPTRCPMWAFMCLLVKSGFLPLYRKGLIGGVLQRWLSFWKVLPLHRGTLELCQSDHWVLGHLSD